MKLINVLAKESLLGPQVPGYSPGKPDLGQLF